MRQTEGGKDKGLGVGEETEAEGFEGKKEKEEDMSGQLAAWETSDF